MSDIKPRELVLIPNTLIKISGLSFLELNSVMLKQWYCELGSPERPSTDDYAPAVFKDPTAASRVERYKSVQAAEVVAVIINMRIDVAGNLVGNVLPQGPKADKIMRAFNRPNCGIVINPRIGYEYGSFNRYDTKVFGFDVGFK